MYKEKNKKIFVFLFFVYVIQFFFQLFSTEETNPLPVCDQSQVQEVLKRLYTSDIASVQLYNIIEASSDAKRQRCMCWATLYTPEGEQEIQYAIIWESDNQQRWYVEAMNL